MLLRLKAVHDDASAGSGITVLVANLSSSDADASSPYFSNPGIRLLRNGNIEEWNGSSWIAQNSTTDWCDENSDSTVGDGFECKMVKTSGNKNVGLADDTWFTISTTRTFQISSTLEGTFNYNGTLHVREIADTGNTDTASVALTLTNGIGEG